MVRLQCQKCHHVWNETKKQSQSEEVHCQKCNELHHKHTKPINPPKPIKVKKKKVEEVPIPQPIKPYEPKVWHQTDVFREKIVSMDPDKITRKRTRVVEKL